MKTTAFKNNLKKHFEANYHPIQIIVNKSSIESSVSIIIREFNSSFEVLLIKRTTKNSDKFSGHMAFPGGVKEVSDKDSLVTAIRETKEEIGLDTKSNCILIGRFSDYKPVNPDVNRFIVSPFIFFLDNTDADLVKCKEEVEDIVWVPLDFLISKLDESNRIGTKNNSTYKDNVFEYKNYKVWGVTGKILYAFLLEIKDYC